MVTLYTKGSTLCEHNMAILLISVNLVVYIIIVQWYKALIGLVSLRSWVQFRQRLLIFFWKSYFHQKVITKMYIVFFLGSHIYYLLPHFSLHRQNRRVWISRETSFTWNSREIFTWISREICFMWISREIVTWISRETRFTWNSCEKFTWLQVKRVLREIHLKDASLFHKSPCCWTSGYL